tara:strand:- start:224 stop:400 length:177 start_codon:yes stop_codon:yes gene_type:complete
MATTALEKAVDNYVDSLTVVQLRDFVFNHLLEDMSEHDEYSKQVVDIFVEQWGNHGKN